MDTGNRLEGQQIRQAIEHELRRGWSDNMHSVGEDPEGVLGRADEVGAETIPEAHGTCRPSRQERGPRCDAPSPLLQTISSGHIFVVVVCGWLQQCPHSVRDAVFPLVSVLQRHWKNNGTGFKHWFQQELGNVLIEQGMFHVQKERMDKAANVLIANYRSGVWKSCWCVIRKGKTSTVNADVRGDRRSKRRSGTGRVGRPAKKKTRRGRPRGSTSGGSRGPGRPRKLSVLEQTRIERFAFCSLPPFVPKQAGRRPTFQSGPTISARGVMHTLTHSRNVMKSGTSERM